MSDYFGALMRSSGMAVGGSRPAVGHFEPGVVEIDVESGPAATPSRTVQTASAPPPAVVPISPVSLVEQPPPSAQSPASTDARDVHAGVAGTEQAHPRAAANAAADSRAAPAERVGETAKPALGQALVRAAMQWVAADTQQVRSAAQVVPPRQQSSPAVGEETGVVATTPAFRERIVEGQVQPPSAMPAAPALPDFAAPEPAAAQALPIRPARATPIAPPGPVTQPVPVAPLARDEIVEISIGAIHVRVDAPAAHTVARPAAPAPSGLPRAATATSHRSALSRRALRRI